MGMVVGRVPLQKINSQTMEWGLIAKSVPRKSIDTFGQITSIYRGVTGACIDGREDMSHIFGIIVVEEKDRLGKAGKIILPMRTLYQKCKLVVLIFSIPSNVIHVQQVKLAEVQHSTEFLSRTTLLQLLSSIISNASADSTLRSRAMMVTRRLLSKDNVFVLVDKSSFEAVVSAIDRRFDFLESQDADECGCALEALGQIWSSNQGAVLLLSSSTPTARHAIDAAFDQQQHNKQLIQAALHALANIVGETRSANDIILTGDAEESLRRLIYQMAYRSSKLTPAGLLQSVLQQDLQLRLAGYRLITGLVARPWCLTEIISRRHFIGH